LSRRSFSDDPVAPFDRFASCPERSSAEEIIKAWHLLPNSNVHQFHIGRLVKPVAYRV